MGSSWVAVATRVVSRFKVYQGQGRRQRRNQGLKAYVAGKVAGKVVSEVAGKVVSKVAGKVVGKVAGKGGR